MNVATEILENSLRIAKEQEIIIQARINRNEKVNLNLENLKENQNEMNEIQIALNKLRGD